MTTETTPVLDEPPFDPDYDTPPPPAGTSGHRANGTTPGTPPHDHAAEQAVLGAMLLTPQAITDVAAILRPGDFYQPRHEAIHQAITHLHQQDHPVDPITVAAELERTGNLARTGGPLYLHDLTAQPDLIPANAPHHAELIRQKARRRTAITTGTRIIQAGHTADDTDLDTIYTRAYEALDQAIADHGPTTPQPTTWTPVNLTQVLAGEYLDPPPTMLTRTDGIPLLYDHAVHVIAGESESGKTWLTLLAATQLLTTSETVTFIDFEDRADRVVGRLLALGATPTQIRDHFHYIRPDRPLDDTGRHQLAPHLPGSRLVILDGVTEAMTMHGLDLNSNADAATFYGLLPRWIADHGPGVALIDHVVKDKEKQDRFALGAQHKMAGIDGVQYIVKMIQPFARGKRGLAQIRIGKDRPGHVREHAFGNTIAEFTLDATGSDVILTAHLTPPGEASGRHGETFEPTYLMEKISRAVQLTPGLSKKALEDLVNGKTPTKRLAIELLVARGHIGTKTGPRGVIQHFHQTPYYQPTDNPEDDQT